MQTGTFDNSPQSAEPPDSLLRIISRERRGKFLLTRLVLRVTNLPEPFHGYTIVQLSDLHHGVATPLEHIREAVQIANSLGPDLFVLTGDMVQVTRSGTEEIMGRVLGWPQRRWFAMKRLSRHYAQELGKVLALLHSKDGTLAVLGNHDHLEGHRTIMRQLGPRLRWLVNASHTVKRAGAELQFIGVDDQRRGKPDFKKALESLAVGPPRLLLVHNPDFLVVTQGLECIQCALAGHTHGGQIRLPLLGAIRTHTKQRKHVQGVSYEGSTAVYVSNGVGYGVIQLRLFCPPEIVVLTLERAV